MIKKKNSWNQLNIGQDHSSRQLPEAIDLIPQGNRKHQKAHIKMIIFTINWLRLLWEVSRRHLHGDEFIYSHYRIFRQFREYRRDFWFQWLPIITVYEPEYTDKDQFETEEKMRRERERAEESKPAATERQQISGDRWRFCGCCDLTPTEDECLWC